MNHDDIAKITQKVESKAPLIEALIGNLSQTIVGQTNMLEKLIIGLLSNGHILLEGVPGLAKTTAVNALASSIKSSFNRIQFTPDLLPADLIGTMIYNPKTTEFDMKKGPIFSNLILADEINRAPSKVQSALLEAMQEKQVTIGNKTHKLPKLFLVLASQNPIEQEGTYPLPEAQVDRFMLKVILDYPTFEDEKKIIDAVTGSGIVYPKSNISEKDILEAREIVRNIYLDEKIQDYIVSIIHATRYPEKYKIENLKNYIQYGGSPRASIFLTIAAKAHAFLKGRGFVTPEDVKVMGPEILRHRISLSYEAQAQDVEVENVIQTIFDSIEVP